MVTTGVVGVGVFVGCAGVVGVGVLVGCPGVVGVAVGLVPETVKTDPAPTAVRWQSASEHGFATWQGDSVVVMLSPNADDLRAATTAAGYNLDAATSPSLAAAP